MSATNTGGPAFPQLDAFVDAKGERPVYTTHDGMTLRDYFAAKAMQGILAGVHPICKDPDPTTEVARVAYVTADAMLKARAE